MVLVESRKQFSYQIPVFHFRYLDQGNKYIFLNSPLVCNYSHLPVLLLHILGLVFHSLLSIRCLPYLEVTLSKGMRPRLEMDWELLTSRVYCEPVMYVTPVEGSPLCWPILQDMYHNGPTTLYLTINRVPWRTYYTTLYLCVCHT